MPTGWTLSAAGVLSGVATADGTYSFTVQAQDSGNPAQTAQAQYTLMIAEPVVITSSSDLSKRVRESAVHISADNVGRDSTDSI